MLFSADRERSAIAGEISDIEERECYSGWTAEYVILSHA